MNKLLATGLIITILSGCGSFASTYVKPEVTPPANWSNNEVLVDKQESTLSLANLKWWENFNNPELNQLIATILFDNNDINRAAINIKNAQQVLTQVQAQWVPTLGLSVGDAIGNIPPLYSNSNTVFSGFFASYTFNVLKIIREQKMADLNISLQQAILNGVRLTIISQTAATYFNLLGAREQLSLAQQTLADLKLQLQYLTIRQNLGLISKIEVKEYQEQVEELAAKLPAMQTNIILLENALQVLLNHNPGKFDTKVAFSQLPTEVDLPHHVPSSVLQQRPDIMIAENQLKIAAAKIGVAYSEFFPHFSIFLPLGALATQPFSAGVPGVSSTYWLTFASAAQPLLDLSAYNNVKLSKTSYTSSQYAYVKAVRSAFSDVDDALAWQKNSSVALNQAVCVKDAANDVYTLAQKRYTSGYISYADTIKYKLQLDKARYSYNQARLAELNSLISLYQALGGGYLAQDTATANHPKEINHG